MNTKTCKLYRSLSLRMPLCLNRGSVCKRYDFLLMIQQSFFCNKCILFACGLLPHARRPYMIWLWNREKYNVFIASHGSIFFALFMIKIDHASFELRWFIWFLQDNCSSRYSPRNTGESDLSMFLPLIKTH